jgi:dTDP-4-dehydrorhamnose reductase
MLRLAKERDELKIVDDQWGAPTWAGWIAHTTCEMLAQGNSANLKSQGLYNYVNSDITTWRGFAQEIFVQAKQQGLLKNMPSLHGITTSDYPTPARRPLNSSLNLQKLIRELGISPQDWQASLRRCLLTN